MELARFAPRIIRPTVFPDESNVRGAGLGRLVSPPLQPKLDGAQVHRSLDDGGVVVQAKAAPVHRLPERFRVGGGQEGVDELGGVARRGEVFGREAARNRSKTRNKWCCRVGLISSMVIGKSYRGVEMCICRVRNSG